MCLIISLSLLLATIIEVELLSLIADELGAGNMWLLLIGTAFIGWRLIGEQRAQQQKVQMLMMRGELTDPSQMMRPLISLLSGILLVIPGPLTDLIGLAMLHLSSAKRSCSLSSGGLRGHEERPRWIWWRRRSFRGASDLWWQVDLRWRRTFRWRRWSFRWRRWTFRRRRRSFDVEGFNAEADRQQAHH